MRTFSSFTVARKGGVETEFTTFTKGGVKTEFTTFTNEMKPQEVISDYLDGHMSNVHVAIERESMVANIFHSDCRTDVARVTKRRYIAQLLCTETKLYASFCFVFNFFPLPFVIYKKVISICNWCNCFE
ncbi:hypothetical protein AVEN_7324-1 [Araneus ventricosus]|uniref:Uncharacterized protein n=1 Tax=Araneus ventricosus TaxID=182803 RepID=A0A4Y2BQ46_ARAVE|nr:hypothetical protein AVEN_7324-1 [Araneus ventricosus]